MAASFFPGIDPISRQVRLPWGAYRVIGIAGNIKVATIERLSRATLYLSADQLPRTDMTLVIRSRLPQSAIVASVQKIVRGLDETSRSTTSFL